MKIERYLMFKEKKGQMPLFLLDFDSLLVV
nr:MAG TPA: hypothetical protein [Caudoviricetes sp.]